MYQYFDISSLDKNSKSIKLEKVFEVLLKDIERLHRLKKILEVVK